MADFDFYVNTYLGDRIQEKAFPALAKRAESILQSFEGKYQVTGGEESRKMAICAMAECIQEHDRRSRHSAASVGSVSVRYEKPRESLERQLYRAAGIYLDIYRGVG